MRQWMWVVVLMAWEAVFAVYVPPVEGAAPFRRDRLPVDVSTMVDLSAQLVTLAAHLDGGAPADSRARAQLIGLALALDPANRRARELNERLENGDEPPAPDAQSLKLARSRAWSLLGWLEQPEAGEDGQAMGLCLSDALAKADSGNPDAGKRASRERGDWSGWVPDLAAYREPGEEPAPDPEPGATDPGGEDPTETTDASLLLRLATVNAPLWIVGEKGGPAELRVVPLEVRAGQGEKNEPGVPGAGGQAQPWLWVNGPYPRGSEWSPRVGPRLRRLLELRHGPLPKALTLSFSLPEGLKFSSRNHGAALGAMFVAADSLFTGVEPSATATVLAEIGEDGGVALPTAFWETLRVLADDPGEGGRVILPQSAWEFLPYLLILDQAEFFMRREVLLAADAEALVTLASAQPPERLLDATEAFDQIRQARGSRSLGSFVSADAVHGRLGAIAKIVPEHASARALALRGTSKWPQRLDRPVYACEIRACLDPMRQVLSRPWEALNVRALQDAEQACRERLKQVERFFGSVDDRVELHDAAVNAVKSLTGVISDFRRRNEFFDTARALRPAVRTYVETMKVLTAAAGDGDRYPIPFAGDGN